MNANMCCTYVQCSISDLFVHCFVGYVNQGRVFRQMKEEMQLKIFICFAGSTGFTRKKSLQLDGSGRSSAKGQRVHQLSRKRRAALPTGRSSLEAGGVASSPPPRVRAMDPRG